VGELANPRRRTWGVERIAVASNKYKAKQVDSGGAPHLISLEYLI
jgi:hypothetical protein